MLNNVTTVRGYAVYLGLDPNDRAVLRKIQRQCERGDLTAELEQGAWLIKVPQNDEGKMIMRDWESTKEVFFEGMTLEHAGYGTDKNIGKDNGKVTLFYVNKVPATESANHFDVTWDFSDFLKRESDGTFEWPSPHAVSPVSDERKQSVVDYFSGSKFKAYGRAVEFNGIALTIINRPIEFAKQEGTLRYYAGATDNEGSVYQVYWNLFNMFEPVEIEMTVDKSRYCKHCLTTWRSNADTERCNHEWVSASEK